MDFESAFVEELEAAPIGGMSNLMGGFGTVLSGGGVPKPASEVTGGVSSILNAAANQPAPKATPSSIGSVFGNLGLVSPMPIPQLPAKPTSPSVVAALSPAAMETLKKTVAPLTPDLREAIAKTPLGFTPAATTPSGAQSLAAQSEEIANLVVSRLSPRITSMERALESIQQARDFLSEHRERMRRDSHYRNQRENLELTRQVLQAVAEIIVRLESPDLQQRAIRVFVNKE